MIFAYKMLECVDNNIIKNTLGRFNEIAIKVCEGQQFDMNFENKELIQLFDHCLPRNYFPI